MVAMVVVFVLYGEKTITSAEMWTTIFVLNVMKDQGLRSLYFFFNSLVSIKLLF